MKGVVREMKGEPKVQAIHVLDHFKDVNNTFLKSIKDTVNKYNVCGKLLC